MLDGHNHRNNWHAPQTARELRRRLKEAGLWPLSVAKDTASFEGFKGKGKVLRLLEASEQEEAELAEEEQRELALGRKKRFEATGEETTRYFKVANAIFDWNLKMPAAFKLVWLGLQRYANNRKVPPPGAREPGGPRMVSKISHERLAEACALDRRVVSSAIRYLNAIGAISVLSPAAYNKLDGTRLTAVYYVPAVSDLSPSRLRKAIRKLRRDHPRLLLLRPDQAQRRREQSVAA